MNDIKKHFLNYELSKELKVLGFNEPCLAYYEVLGYKSPKLRFVEYEEDNPIHNNINFNDPTAPLISQVFNWLLSVHNIDTCIFRADNKKYLFLIDYKDSQYYLFEDKLRLIDSVNDKGIYDSPICYETKQLAELEAIKECIKIIKEKK